MRCSPCCLRSLFSPSQLASEPAETRSVGPATLTNWPLFTPHFPWCLCRTPSHAAYFFELSLPSPPMHQSPLSFPYLCFLCWSPAPTRVPQGAQLLSVSASVRLSVSTLFPPPTPPLSLSLSISLSLQMSPPVALSYILSISQKHPYYFSTNPILLLNSQIVYPNPSTSTCTSDSMFFSMLPPDLCLSKRDTSPG